MSVVKQSAYVKEIDMNTEDSHQTCPGYLLTVIRWRNRDSFNYKHVGAMDVCWPMVIYNDAISVTVSNNKTSITPSLQAVLKATDINYATAIAPGDFVFVNMVNDETKISVGSESDQTLRNRAVGLRPINNYEDGFKGMFKVQTCRKRNIVNPITGVKTLVYQLVAFGFTEFNSSVYYNPVVYGSFQGKFGIFAAQFEKFWDTLVSDTGRFNIQDLMIFLIKTLLGQGPKQQDLNLPSPNMHYQMPSGVGALLGVPSAKHASEIYNYVFGVWQSSNLNSSTPGTGFNPSVTATKAQGFYVCPHKLDGLRVPQAEFWNNVKVWAILQQYLNPTINEMYTTFRVNPENKVMPTLIVRQKPFSSLHYKAQIATTRFLQLPRWKISPNLLYDIDLGKDEAARINFVQIFTRSQATNENKDKALQTGTANYAVDIDDIGRSGLRPYIATAPFDFPTDAITVVKGKEWAKLVADWLFAGQLRESGTLSFVGIEEPISVGDNLEFDGVVYHIESLNHTMGIDTNGNKSFRTNMTVSFGTDMRSTETTPIYPNMDDQTVDNLTKTDWEGERILPGIGEAQDVIPRENGEENTLKAKGDRNFTPPLDQKPHAKVETNDGTTKTPSKN